MENKESSIISLRDYFGKEKTFVIPAYQRGYVWGKTNPEYSMDSVSYLLQSIDTIIEDDSKKIFLQGVTVIDDEKEIIIIDGQQRTTCLFIILRMLGYKVNIKFRYEIRKQSNDELPKIGPNYDYTERQDEDFQDIYFFKKTARLVSKHFENLDHNKVVNKILDQINILYIDVHDPSQQTLIFSMMNGNKAKMLDAEIIKADLLRIASRTPEPHSNEYENDALRSRYAREWDKWLYWWNKPGVVSLFKTEGKMMGWLLPVIFCAENSLELNSDTANVKYESFRDSFLKNEQFQKAKETFTLLRRLQKRFEDAYNDAIYYNYIGGILNLCEKEQRLQFIQWFFSQDYLEKSETQTELKRYYRWCFIGHTHNEIVKNLFNKEHFERISEILFQDDVYNDKGAYNVVAKWLLMQNIDQDCLQEDESTIGRKFDFGIWNNRSLEHIFPKSRVKHQDNDNPNVYLGGDNKEHPDDYYKLNRSDLNGCTEHSIGNLVLLYGADNSAFGADDFEQKKLKFFNSKEKPIFKSRHLIHTISVFAKSKWGKIEIEENQNTTKEVFMAYYPEYSLKIDSNHE